MVTKIIITKQSIRYALFDWSEDKKPCKGSQLNKLGENEANACTVFDSFLFNWMVATEAASPCLNFMESGKL